MFIVEKRAHGRELRRNLARTRKRDPSGAGGTVSVTLTPALFSMLLEARMADPVSSVSNSRLRLR